MGKRLPCRLGLLLVAMLLLQGCAAVGLLALGTAGAVAAGTGTNYTLDGIAYRTFTAPIADVERAAQTTLKKMDMTLRSNEKTKTGSELVADAGDRKIYVELERVTSRTTRMRITAKQGWFWRDRATAGEFIVQTEHALDEMPVLSKTR
jgi:uncharacterized protein DUF3568